MAQFKHSACIKQPLSCDKRRKELLQAALKNKQKTLEDKEEEEKEVSDCCLKR